MSRLKTLINSKRATFVFGSVIMCAPWQGAAQQQAPTQHAPSHFEYGDLHSEPAESPDDKASSRVTLTWKPIPGATEYLLQISKDPSLHSPFSTIAVHATSYQTPELEPGAYYYTVEARTRGQSLGKTLVEGFVIGKPLSVHSRKARLPAPTIVGPKHMDLFPTYGYVRLAWQPIAGVRGYRFRIWNADKVRENFREKLDTPPRWVTEVKNPWIEIHDAPYSSYMYLETGVYRWEVAGVDKEGGVVGDPAIAFFETSRQWFLKTEELYLRPYLMHKFNEVHRTSSGNTGVNTNYSASDTAIGGEADWFFSRHWGLNLASALDMYSARATGDSPANTMHDIRAELNLLLRTYLSTVPYGWTFTLNAGLGFEEVSQIDNITTTDSNITKLKVFGPKLGFKIAKRFDSPFELQFFANALLPLYLSGGLSSTNSLRATLNGFAELRALYHFNQHTALMASFGDEQRWVAYSPMAGGSTFGVFVSGWATSIGVQLDYFPEPDNSKYYPEAGRSSYYPTEKRNHSIDSRQQDTSSWQRWKP